MNNLFVRTLCIAAWGGIWFFALIFIPAWTFDYWQGWVFFLTMMLSTTAATLLIGFHDKKLLEGRLRMGPSVEKSKRQKIITGLGSVVFVATIALMVLDHRFGWSSAVSAWVSILGDTLIVVGILVYAWVTRVNSFAVTTVEIQEGQRVVSNGPYAIVRHPMYGGAILVFVGSPLALGSWWGLLVVPLSIGFFAWRLLDEEKVLCEGLAGYGEYMVKVRYRLVPYVW